VYSIFNIYKFSYSASTSDFTNLIWNASTQAGFGLATGLSYGYSAYTCVAILAPKGNVAGQYPANVKPLNATALNIVSPPPTTTTTTTTTTTPFSMDICIEQMRLAGLNAHNSVRGYHGVQNLTRNSSIETTAQAYAQQLLSIGSLIHSHMPGLGENIFWRGISTSYVKLDHAYCKRNNLIFPFCLGISNRFIIKNRFLNRFEI